MKILWWMVVTISCLIAITKCEKTADAKMIEEEAEDDGNLIDEMENEKLEGNCNNNCDADNNSNDGIIEDTNETVETEEGDEIETINADNEPENNKNIDESQTSEGYVVRDEKTCRTKKNSEKLSKVIRKTVSVKEKGQKVKDSVQGKAQKADKKVQSDVKQGKVKRDTRKAESFKQISKNSNGGKYRDQQQKQKVQKGGKNEKAKSTKNNQKNEKGSYSKKSQKNKKKMSKNEL